MQSFGRFLIVRFVFGAVLCFVASFSLAAADTNSTYVQWIKPWTQRSATSPALTGDLKLIVSNIRGEVDSAQAITMTPVQRLKLAYHIRVSATEVATNGAIRSYVVSNTDARTSEARWLSPKEIRDLTDLISILPTDDSTLPPAGNRVVIQVRADNQWQVHVYDGNHLPTEAQSILNFLAQPNEKLF
jgi:hypothetical protein